MAKIVLAGRSDCPYYARCERLADRLAKNLQKFKLHKILVQPDQWQNWLENTCKERGWTFSKSPIIWRELIDRGGKGVLIGGAIDFQEYVKAYYNIEAQLDSNGMLIIASENKATKDVIDNEERLHKSLIHPVYVCITNASSPVCYHLLNSISSGDIFGCNTKVIFRLLVSSAKDLDKAKSYAMEAEDIAHEALKSIHIYCNPQEAFDDCSIIILMDSLSRLASESQKDWLYRNAECFIKYANIMDTKALKSCKVIVCGEGPKNFNATVVMRNAPNLSRQNIVALSTIVENQAKVVVGERFGVNSADVVNLIVWGSIKERLLDLTHCRIYRYTSAITGPSWHSKNVQDMIHNRKFEETQLPKLVSSITEKVLDAMGSPTSLSISAAIYTILQYWYKGSPEGQIFSLGVCSEGWYDVPSGLIFSFPVRIQPHVGWSVISDLEIKKATKASIHAATAGCRRGEAVSDTAHNSNLLVFKFIRIVPQWKIKLNELDALYHSVQNTISCNLS